MTTGYEQPGDPNFEGGAAFERHQQMMQHREGDEAAKLAAIFENSKPFSDGTFDFPQMPAEWGALCARALRAYAKLNAPCEYCGPGKMTGLPGNACENCMNTGLKNPTAEDFLG